MTELLFMLRMAGITFFVVILMQIRVSDETIENHASQWIRTAPPVLFLREVAEGGLLAIHDGWVKVTSGVKTKYWNKFDEAQLPGKRHLQLGVERSEAYIAEQQAKAAAALEEQRAAQEAAKAALKERGKKAKSFFGLGSEDEGLQKAEATSSDAAIEDQESVQ